MLTAQEIGLGITRLYNATSGDFNDAITRNNLRNQVSELIHPYRHNVVCDERNNPPAVLERNGLGLDVEFMIGMQRYIWSSRRCNHTPSSALETVQ